MSNGIRERAEVAIINYEKYLTETFENLTISDDIKLRFLKKTCETLKEAYEATLTYLPRKGFGYDIPGSRPRGEGKVPEGYDLPEKDDNVLPLEPDLKVIVNPEKINILNEALALGCQWAIFEMLKLKKLKVTDSKDLLKSFEE